MSVYLLLGPEEGEKKEFIEREKKRVLSMYSDAELYTFFVGDDTEEALYAALSQSSLFSSYRFIVIKGFENATKTDGLSKALIEYSKNPDENAEVIILSLDTSTSTIPKEIAGLAGKDNTRIYWELKESDKINWIRNYVREQGFSITKEAIDEILSSVDNNTLEMKNLVSSITLFLELQKNTKVIDDSVIESYAARTKGENGYTLFNAVAEKDLEHALLIVASIVLQDIREVTPAFTVLQNQFRRLEACLEMKAMKISERQIFTDVEYFSTYAPLKPIKGINFKQAPVFSAAMRNYTLSECSAIVLYLGRMDSEIKAAGTDMTKLLLEEVIYNIIEFKAQDPKMTLEPACLYTEI